MTMINPVFLLVLVQHQSRKWWGMNCQSELEKPWSCVHIKSCRAYIGVSLSRFSTRRLLCGVGGSPAQDIPPSWRSAPPSSSEHLGSVSLSHCSSSSSPSSRDLWGRLVPQEAASWGAFWSYPRHCDLGYGNAHQWSQCRRSDSGCWLVGHRWSGRAAVAVLSAGFADWSGVVSGVEAEIDWVRIAGEFPLSGSDSWAVDTWTYEERVSSCPPAWSAGRDASFPWDPGAGPSTRGAGVERPE